MTVFSVVLWAFSLAVSIPLFVLGVFNCIWTTYAWHSPQNYEHTKFDRVRRPRPPRHQRRYRRSFSVIVPVRDESYRVMQATVGCLVRQTHPRVQAVLSVGYDDPDTLAAGRRLVEEDRSGRLCLSVSYSDVHNKPTQLNSALRDCTGDVVGILDADSLSAPELLTYVDEAFQQDDVTVVQGGVAMTNYRSSWVALRSSLEYYAHHRSKMHFSAAHGAILMGGNTVFFDRGLLDELGGWDASNLAEDAEISLRIMAQGHRVTVAYEPHLVSREEAPIKVRAWTKQRTRWNLGFLQTIDKDVSSQFPRAQRRLTRWHLFQPLLMALTGVVFPVSVLAFFLSRPPLPIAMLTWLPAFPTLYGATVECVLLYLFTHEPGTAAARVRDYAKLLASVLAYQWMLAFASLRAVVKFGRAEFGWDKTHHAGHHLEPAPSDVSV